ncbi:reverse transcriptase [Trichonephila clavipes]|nr:reverse transcriptase [Trichonephila clavipes]
MNCQTKLRINHLTAVKSVAILEMVPVEPNQLRLLQCNSRPASNLFIVVQTSSLSNFGRAKRVDYRYWNDCRCTTQRLKTQISLLHEELLMKKHQLPLVTTLRAPIQFYFTVATALPSKRLNLTNMKSNKADVIPEELKSCALETIEERYPANEWLIPAALAVHTCQKQTEPTRDGSVGCLKALWVWERTPLTTMCRTKITALQWAPSHVGIPGNERADQKAKQGAESSQPEVSLTLRRAKIISTHMPYTAMTKK